MTSFLGVCSSLFILRRGADLHLTAVKYLPSWLPFQKTGRQGKEMIERLVTKPFEHVKHEIVRRSFLDST